MKHPIRFPLPHFDEERYWQDVHEDNYDTVFSVTQDGALLGQILDVVARDTTRDILIPGCGTRTHLQQALLDRFGPSIETIICTDFEPVVSLARPRLSSPQVEFVGCPTQELAFEEVFSVAIVVNSVVSADDALNRAMLGRISAGLRSGGRLIGLFPTIFTDIDLLSLGHDNQPVIDVRRNLIFESVQGVWQLAYSPLRLRLILKEAGLQLSDMRIVFLDSEEFLKQGREYYGIVDPDLPIWQLLVEARKL